MRAESSPSTAHVSATQKRVERFVEKYVDSQVKAELLRILAFRPSQFQTLPEILALTKSSSAEIERAIFTLRGLGLLQLKDSPRGTAVALAHDSVARRLAPALWAFLKKAASQQPQADGSSSLLRESQSTLAGEGNNARLRLS